MTTRARDRGRRSGKRWIVAFGVLAVLAGWPAQAAAPAARAFLQVDLPKHKAYVGESLPVTVRAYYRGGTSVTVTGAPALDSPDFTLTEAEPTQGRVDLGDSPYLVVTWKGRLSPVKAGRYVLGMTLPSTLKWQSVVEHPVDPSGSSAGGRDPFGSFFDDLPMGGGQDILGQMQRRMQRMMSEAQSGFDLGAVQQKDVVLRSSAALDVAALPTQGRPPSFSGAVGRFDVSASATPAQLRAGEPIALELRVTGQGSFDRLDTPGLAESDDWKTYAPSGKQADDKTKVFTQALVPKHAGVSAIPPIAISYFDPDAARYVTSATQAIPVDVAPGASIAAGSNGVAPPVASGPALAPDADLGGPSVSSLEPAFRRRGFWLAQAAPLLGLGGLFVGVLVRRRVLGDVDRPYRVRADRALRDYGTQMDRAVERRDPVAFFAAARGALQERLGARWRMRPEAITLSEIHERLDAGDGQTIRQVFDSDAARFSGASPEAPDLARWRQAVTEQLHHLEDT
jgi:hypothetical protein